MGVMETNIFTPFSPPFGIDEVPSGTFMSEVFVSEVFRVFVILENFGDDNLSLPLWCVIPAVVSTDWLNKGAVINLRRADKTFIVPKFGFFKETVAFVVG